MSILWQLIEFILLAYLGLSSLYLLVFALAGLFTKNSKSATSTEPKILVMLPSYKEDAVILNTSTQALLQDYPSDNFEVMVMADQLKAETIEAMRNKGVNVLEVHFEKSTKSKSLNAALKSISKPFDLVLILDADNLMEPTFLQKIAAKYQAGARVIQGRRVAKNLNTGVAFLDAVSEAINYTIYNKGHKGLNLSSRLVGSGMALDFNLFKQVMPTIDAVGGFDKEFELKLIEQKIFIDYVHDALVYDEKVQNAKVFGNQRKRWISSQFHYLGLYFMPALKAMLTKGNFDFFNKAFQMMLPPRLLMPFFILIFAIISFLLNSDMATIWAYAFLANVFANLFALPKSFYTIQFIKALFKVPGLILKTLVALFTIKGANKKFIHTPHSS